MQIEKYPSSRRTGTLARSASPNSPFAADLPEHSRAAAAQRLNERSPRPARGLYYPVPHLNPHPHGWRTRRYLKRKNLRMSNRQYAATDSLSNRWSMMPLALGSLLVAVVLAGILVGLVGAVTATQQRYGQQVTTLLDILPGDSLKMYDARGTLIYQMLDQGLQTTVPLSQISPNLAHAEIAIEDQYFWSNPGYDITGIVRAALADLTSGRIVAGGSTITQQLIKNTIVGNRDTAMLAGIPSNPSAYDPYLHPKAALNRMKAVLTQMYLQGYITSLQVREAIAEAQQRHFLHHGIIHNNLAPHFANYALNELATTLHVKRTDLARLGLVVSTSLDLQLQNKILKIAQQHIAELARAHHMSDAAVVMIDFHNGAIRVLLGNIDPNNPRYGAFDVASQGYRQSGSSFKPFIYATAFAKGLSPGMPILDAPLTIQMCCGLPSYTPHNYDGGYHGLLPVRNALQNSFNIPAVKVLLRVGVDNALHMAQKMGITSYVGTPNYTMVLGTLGIHLLDETAGFGVFANGGVRIPPHAIDTVVNTQGQLIYHFVSKGQRVISKQVAYMMTNVLSDNTARTFEFGKCSSLFLYSNTASQCYAGDPGLIRPAAVKTGTSQDFRDNWTVGYTTDYVMGVWAGNNDNSPMTNITGVDGAAPIWHDSLLLAEQGRPAIGFQNPGGLVKRTVHYGGITTTDWYIEGVPWTNWGLG